MGERSVLLSYGTETAEFGWRAGMPARDFGAHLAEAVRSLTGLASLEGLEMFAEMRAPLTDIGATAAGAAPVLTKVTPRDLFEDRVQSAAGRSKVVITKVAQPPRSGVTLREPQHPRSGAGLLRVPQRAVPQGSKFQKKGGSQMQFMRVLEMDKDPAGLGGGSRTRRIPMEEVAQHNSRGDIWMVLNGRVFNITPYMEYHPGGKSELMRAAGSDGSSLFNEIHRWVSVDMLDKLQVGLLDASSVKSGPRLALPGASKFAQLGASRLAPPGGGLAPPGGGPSALDPMAWRRFPLVSRKQVGHDCVLLRFDIGKSKISGLRPGQHLKLRLGAGAAGLAQVERQYTPVSDVEDPGVLELLVKIYPTGKLGPALAQLRPQQTSADGDGGTATAGGAGACDYVEMQGPFGALAYEGGGRFSVGATGSASRHSVAAEHLVMIAAGSGITPMVQLLRPIMDEWRRESHMRVTVVSCNRREDDIIFRQDLERLASEFARRMRLRLMLSQPTARGDWPASKGQEEAWADVKRVDGRIGDEVLREALTFTAPGVDAPAPPLTACLALVCGPEGFCDAAAEALARLGVAAERLFVF